ncbi:hypothetical protein [Holdemania filiformis]|uniref:hypothetical protein n=1 Tax=Holdemania filiformis TaxID=61171 RepID=UPI003A92C607
MRIKKLYSLSLIGIILFLSACDTKIISCPSDNIEDCFNPKTNKWDQYSFFTDSSEDQYNNRYLPCYGKIDEMKNNIIGAWYYEWDNMEERITYFLDNGIYMMYSDNLVNAFDAYPYRFGFYYFADCDLVLSQKRFIHDTGEFRVEKQHIDIEQDSFTLYTEEENTKESPTMRRVEFELEPMLNGAWIPDDQSDKTLTFDFNQNEGVLLTNTGQREDVFTVRQLNRNVIYLGTQLLTEMGIYKFELDGDHLHLFPLFREQPNEDFISLTKVTN